YVLTNTVKNLTVQNSAFTNVSNNVFWYNGSSVVYDGVTAVIENIKILNNVFDNATRIYFQGVENSLTYGYIRGLEIAGNEFKNMEGVGSIIRGHNVENFSIHHNIVDNVN